MSTKLVRVNKYSKKIVILPFYKRIGFEYPVLVQDIVAKKLAEVTEILPSHLKLQIDAGYRTPQSQQEIWNERFKQFRKQYPMKSQQRIFEMTNRLVFNPDYGTPPHTTGGAVDVTLASSRTNREINLSAPLKDYFQEPQLYSKAISEKSQKLRLLLNKSMLKAGFAPHPDEYWHFSYGDEMWSNYYGKRVLFKKIDKLPSGFEPTEAHILFRKTVRNIFRKKRKVTNKISKGLGHL